MAEAKGSYVGGTPVYFKDEKARAMLSNEYVPAENYAAGNLCIHEGKLYKATKATTGTWDATAWTETNLAEVNAGMQKSITDLTEKTNSLDNRVRYLANQDNLNGVLKTGIYGVNNADNCPTEEKRGTLIVGELSSGFITGQLFIEVWNGSMYYRRYYSNSWSEWKKLL